MGWKGLIQVGELAPRVEEALAQAPEERKLRVYDASVVFERSEQGLRASPGRSDYEAGHVPTAQFVDHQADLSSADTTLNYTLLPPAQLEVALRRLGVSADSEIVVYSTSHMMWATRLWWVLRSCGIEAVHVLDGGLAAWRDAGHPVTQTAATPIPGDVRVRFDAARWADRDEVAAAVGSGAVCTLNALPAETYRGEGDLVYGRRGRIRGSVNVPFGDLVRGGRVRPEAELREHFDRVGALSKDRVVTYCGGGIAATLAAFALDQLGHPDVGVYDGSMSEWGADPALPADVG